MNISKHTQLLLFALFLFLRQLSWANSCPILKGKIVSNGMPIPFATIILTGTSRSTVADLDGNWEIENLSQSSGHIRVQSVGYKTFEQYFDCAEGGAYLLIELKTDYVGLDEVVVTASRYATARNEAPVIVNVLKAGNLQSGAAVCLSDGLSLVSGLRVENNCQNCGFQQVRINGLEGPYSQILIDSRPVISALSGVYGIEQIPLSMIERVEVVRGGGSALYGSNAIAGTINIITREPLSNEISANFSQAWLDGVAPDRNYGLNLTMVNMQASAGMSLFASMRNRSHWDANGDGFSEIGLIEAKNAGIRAYAKNGKKGKTSAAYHYIHEFRRGGNKFELKPHETDITEQTEHHIHGGELTYDQLRSDGLGKWSVYASGQYIDRNSYYGAGMDPNAYGKTSDITLVGGTQWHRMTKLSEQTPLNIVAGAELLNNRMHDRMPGYNRDLRQHIHIAGIFGQTELKYSKMSMLAGLRIDRHNLIAPLILSPRFTLLVNPAGKTQWRTSFSTGFRAPQAFDEDLHIIAVNGGVMLIRLASDLKPEYSQSLSSSIETNTIINQTPVNAVAEIFYTQLKDVFVLEVLETDIQGNMIVERRNGSGARVYGLNLEQRMEIDDKTSLQAGFTIQRSIYSAPEIWSEEPTAEPLKQLPKSPNAYGYLSMNRSWLARWDANLNLKYTGPMKVLHYKGYVQHDRIKTSPPFLEIDLKAAYTLPITDKWKLKIEAGVQNMLNSYQKDFDIGPLRDAGYMYGPMKPRTVFAGLKINGN